MAKDRFGGIFSSKINDPETWSGSGQNIYGQKYGDKVANGATKDRFGYGNEVQGSTPVDEFSQVLLSMGIDPNVTQEDLWNIYDEAERNNNVEVMKRLDEYYDYWN